jgi:colanic acid/amylovoran biosynthesis glycosyltransferase
MGESFLMAEVANLSKLDHELYIVPLYPRGKKRDDWRESKNISTFEIGIFSFSIFFVFLRQLVLKPLLTFRALNFLLKNSTLNFILVKNLVSFPKAVWLARQIEDLQIEHIHVQWGGVTATMGMLAAKIAGCEWSLTCHRWDIYEDNLLALKSKSAKFIRFISERGLKDSLKFGVQNSNAVVIPMGVTAVSTPPVLVREKATPSILCAANLIEVKGHEYLIKAISILKKKGLKVHLLLAGEGPLRASLMALVKEHELTDTVDFLGNISHESLIKLYISKAIDLFVLPSVDLGNGLHEGIPVSLMEAMSFGVPVISTKTGSIEELLDPSLGLTVVDKSPLELADKIAHLLEDPVQYTETSKIVGKLINDSWTSAASAARLSQLLVGTTTAIS